MECRISRLHDSDVMFLYDNGKDVKFKLYTQLPRSIVMAHEGFMQSFSLPKNDLGGIVKYCVNVEKIKDYANNFKEGVVVYEKLFDIFTKASLERKISSAVADNLKLHFKNSKWTPVAARNQLIILGVYDIINDVPSGPHPNLIRSCEYLKMFADDIPAYLKQERKT